MAKVILQPRKARPFWYGHPWVFSGAIDRVRGSVKDGDIVDLLDPKGKTIGQGFYNGRSQIRVRLVALQHEGPLNEAFLLRRLDQALDLRLNDLQLGKDTNVLRLVHSEGDGLPGLVVDKIADWLVVQVSSKGLAAFMEPLLDRLEERLSPKGIIERVSSVAVEEEGLVREEGCIRGSAPDGAVEIRENGLSYFCDPMGGQKTGFYADQRENRRLLAPLARGKTVLDAFSYVGGFGLRMAMEGAAEVLCVDSSEPALAFAKQGAEAAGVEDRLSVEKGNVLRVLDHFRQEERRFQVAVMDPPKLVHKRGGLRKGLTLYHEINSKAVRVIEDCGLLITCSCSQHVLADAFDEMLASVAKEEGVRLQEIHRGTQAPDHPIMLPMDESRYLKVRALRVIREKQG